MNLVQILINIYISPKSELFVTPKLIDVPIIVINNSFYILTAAAELHSRNYEFKKKTEN